MSYFVTITLNAVQRTLDRAFISIFPNIRPQIKVTGTPEQYAKHQIWCS